MYKPPIRFLVLALAGLLMFSCADKIKFITKQPVYFGDRVTPTKTLNSPNIQYLKWRIYGSDSKSSYSTGYTSGGTAYTKSSSKRYTRIAINVAKAVKNDHTKFLANASLQVSEIVSFGWIISGKDFSSKLYQVQAGGKK